MASDLSHGPRAVPLDADLNDDHDDLLWLDQGSCDYDESPVNMFFVEAGHTISPEVLSMCRGCPVRRQCLEHAYRLNYTSGYFAGLSPSRRAAMTLPEAIEFIEADSARYRATLNKTRPASSGA